MNQYYPNLFKPLKVKKTVFRNRIFSAPGGIKSFTDHNHLAERVIDYQAHKAAGGVAAVTLGDCIVHPTGAVEWNPKMNIFDYRSEMGLNDYANAVHAGRALCSVELMHAGMHLHDDNRINYGPSDMVDSYDQGDGSGPRVHKIREMPREVIEEVVDAYGKAALRAKRCGVDMVLIHAGHGWLLSQFLSPIFNKRTDEFGGSIENRARITTMVVDRIRHYCGRNYPIEVRISHKEGLTEGYQLEDIIEFCKLLEAHDVDMIQVSAGSLHFPETSPLSHPGWFDLGEGKNVEAATEIKKHLHIPVGSVGNISDPAYMEQVIAEGRLDYVVVGRALIADPELPRKAMLGRTDEIRPCIGCLACHTGSYNHLPIFCSVNPIIGRDHYFVHEHLPAKPCRVLIAGGGPAGMQAALTAAERGHDVILCEKRDRLGGIIPIIDCEPFKYRLKNFIEYLDRTVRKAKVDIRLSTEVTPELVAQINPDVLIAAVGGSPVGLPVKGYEKTLPILKYYDEHPEIGEKVILLGGGFAGVECAVGLAMEGKTPVIVEMNSQIASASDAPGLGTGIIQMDALNAQIKKYGIEIHLNTKCIEVTDSGVVCENQAGERIELKADTVIAAAGMRPNSEMVDKLRETVNDFFWIGDSYAVGTIRTAIRDGFDTAMTIGNV